MKYAPVFLTCALTVGLAAACSSDRSPGQRVINLPGKRAGLPYSHGVVLGNILYLGARSVLTPKRACLQLTLSKRSAWRSMGSGPHWLRPG